MKLTADTALNAGKLVLGVAGVVLLYKLVKGGANVLSSTGEAIGGAVYTAINGDANAKVQTQFQQEMAALKAAGYPAVGSAAYNSIVAQYDPAQVVYSSAAGG